MSKKLKRVQKDCIILIYNERISSGVMGIYVTGVSKYNGILSDKSIERAINEGDIFIAPFDRKQLQPAGYNLTPTCFVYSTKRKCLLNVIKSNDETYVMIDKNDTVLIKTRESIAISSVLAGNFFSKVKTCLLYTSPSPRD